MAARPLLVLLMLPALAEAILTGVAEAHAAHAGAGANRGQPSLKLRPNAGGGADVVGYGMFLRSITDIDLMESTFSCDVVVTLQWKDYRAIAVVPEGHDGISLSDRNARKKIWVPDVIITNHRQGSLDPISTTYSVSADGTVTKVQRVQATLMTVYDTMYFPFDHQDLLMQVGSKTHMLEELRFRPLLDDTFTGVAAGTFDNSDFTFTNFTTDVVEEVDGPLRKSRGRLIILVDRRSEPYWQSLLLPELLILLISWSNFWYPLTAPFAMPRVATALVSFLSLVMLELRTAKMVPLRGDLSWIGLFEMNCQSLMFMNVCLNIFILVVYHRFKQESRAKMIQLEVHSIFPCLALILFSICAFTSSKKASLGVLGGMSNSFLMVFFIGFICYEAWMLKQAIDKGKVDGRMESPRPFSFLTDSMGFGRLPSSA